MTATVTIIVIASARSAGIRFLQPVLQRPDERDDEKTKRQRREDDVSLIGGDGNRDRRDQPDRNVQGRVASH